MPVTVEKRGSRWALVEAGGRVVATSDTKAKAEASARIRNEAYREKRRHTANVRDVSKR